MLPRVTECCVIAWTTTFSVLPSLDSNGKERFVGEITPSDTGLTLIYCNDSPTHNCVMIQGVPVKPGIVTVRVLGGFFGTNVATGGEFDKTYTIKIKDSEDSS